MAEFDYSTRQVIRKRRQEELERRLQRLPEHDRTLAQEIMRQYYSEEGKMSRIVRQFREQREKKPSQWFEGKGMVSGVGGHRELLEAFVPPNYRESYLYIIDKLNQFPFSYGWQRRTVRTRAYWAQVSWAFTLLNAYEKLYYCGERLEDFIYRRLNEEKLDYIRSDWGFTRNFSLIYAAEIDRGNQAVIDALKDLILSENNAAYLDREMILGILRSDNKELQKLVCDLLLAARLQEGLRQAICEAMDEGTREAFLALLQVIEDNDLLRYSSVKRSVSTWIGIFDEKNVDRVNGKLLGLMGRCLREEEFCREQLKSNDSIAISAALWALGFEEMENAVAAMLELIEHGTKNQKLTASFYNLSLFDDQLKMQAAKKVILEHTEDLELVAAFMPAFHIALSGWISGLLYGQRDNGRELAEPKKPVLTDYFADREEAELQYEKFRSIYKSLPQKGVVYDPCIFPWYRVELKPSEAVRQLAFVAYVLGDEEKMTESAELLGEVHSDGYGSERAKLLNLLLYRPANRTQRELLIGYMGNAEVSTSDRAVALVKRLTFEKEDYRLIEDMLRFKRSRLRNQLLEFLMSQEDGDMEECLKRLLGDKNEEKRSAALDLFLRLSKEKGKEAFYARVRTLAEQIKTPTDKEKVLLEEILGGAKEESPVQKGWGVYDPDAPERIPETAEGNEALLQCVALSEQEIIGKLKKLDELIRQNRDYEYETANGERKLLSNGYVRRKQDAEGKQDRLYVDGFRLKNYPLEQEFRTFYEREIGSYSVFLQMEARFFWRQGEAYENENTHRFYRSVLGKFPFQPLPLALEYFGQVQGVMRNYRYEFLDKDFLLRTGLQAAQALCGVVDRKNKTIEFSTAWNGPSHTRSVSVGSLLFLNRFLEGLGCWSTDQDFAKAFYAAWSLELKCAEERESGRFQPSLQVFNSLNAQAITPITPYWFLKAYHLGMVSEDILYKAVLNYITSRNLNECDSN